MPKPINSYHAALLTKQTELLGALASREEIHIQGRAADPLDEAVASSARNVAVENQNRNAGLLRQVKKAIDKILHGEFGECEGCGDVIPGPRLNVVPWAELCLGCQIQIEKEKTLIPVPKTRGLGFLNMNKEQL